MTIERVIKSKKASKSNIFQTIKAK